MKSNNKEKYLDIYYKCLNQTYQDHLIKPLLEILYNLVDYLERDIKRGSYDIFVCDFEYHDELRTKFISEIIPLFIRLASCTDFEHVLNACKYSLKTHKNVLDVVPTLNFVFFPQEVYLEDIKRYHSEIFRILTYKGSIDAKKYNFKCFGQDFNGIIDSYLDYGETINYDHECRWRFTHYMEIVLGYYYKEKYDISLFQKVMDYVYYNSESLDEYKELNSSNDDNEIDVNFESICMNKIMDGCIKDIPSIK